MLAASLDPLPAKMDVSDDGEVTALDALMIVNAVSRQSDDPHLDVNYDGKVTAADALNVINHLRTLRPTTDLQSEQVFASESLSETPSAVVTLPGELRLRDLATLTVDSLSGITPDDFDELEIRWGDGRNLLIPSDQLIFPLTRVHRYFGDPRAVTVTVHAISDGQVTDLSTSNLNLIGNSPAVIDRSAKGFSAELFGDATLSGPPIAQRIDPTIDFDFGADGPDPRLNLMGAPFSVRWSGIFIPEISGEHRLFASTGAGDEIRLTVDSNVLLDTFGSPTAAQQSTAISWSAGVPVNVEVEFVGAAGDSRIELLLENDQSLKTAFPSHRVRSVAQPIAMRGGVLAEQFPVNAGATIGDLRALPEFIDNTPTAGFDEPDFKFLSPVVAPEATRLRGLVRAPVTGNYVFHLAAGGLSELWLSRGVVSDTSELIASVSVPTAPEDFDDPNAGVSQSVFLVAGQDYYLETLTIHDDLQTSAHTSVGWVRPDAGGTPAELIDASSVRPVVPEVSVTTDVSQTHEAESVATRGQFVITRSDDLGRDLSVAYTLGGSAVNGVDYAALTGIAVIPAGQESVVVFVDPIDDGVEDAGETVEIRLVADPGYQLGVESLRSVEITISGEIDLNSNVGTQLLPESVEELLDDGFTAGAASNSFTTFLETEPSLPFVGPGSEDNAIRVDVSTFTNPWDVLIGYGFDAPTIPDGSQMFASVWARGAASDGTNATLAMRLQENQSPYAGAEQQWDLGTEWQPIVWPIAANLGGNIADRSIDIRLGYKEQVVELGGFQLIRFDVPPDPSSLPQPIYSYAGRSQNSGWRSDASDSIETVRSSPAGVQLVDTDGNPIQGAVIQVTPLQSKLPIGTAVSPELIVPESNEAIQPDESRRYQAVLEKYNDRIVDGGTLQWGSWESNPTIGTEFLQWVTDLQKGSHGHALIWGAFSATEFPTPSSLLTGYNEQVGENGSLEAERWLKEQILRHVSSTGPGNVLGGRKFPSAATSPVIPAGVDWGDPSLTPSDLGLNSSEPLISAWDAINHPIFSRDIWDIVGNAFMAEVLQAARDTVNTETVLGVNEFDVLSNIGAGNGDDFENLLTLLDQTDPDGRSEFDFIGFQSHFVSDRLPPIDQIMSELDRFATFDRDIQITEFDLDNLLIDDQTQADFTRDFYLALASRERVSVATLWGIWDSDHWRTDEGAELINADWSVKHNGQWLVDLWEDRSSIGPNTRTRTTDSLGQADLLTSSDQVQLDIQLPNGKTFQQVVSTTDASLTSIVAPTFVVNTTLDPNSIVIDGQCDDGSGNCSLREAILESNAKSNSVFGPDRIGFAIDIQGYSTIELATSLPPIEDPVVLDGTTQSGFQGKPIVQISGTQASVTGSGLVVSSPASGSQILGLSIHGFGGDAIELAGADETLISGNQLGVNQEQTAVGNGRSGLQIRNGSDNVVSANVISNNAGNGIWLRGPSSSNNRIWNNMIGLSPSGGDAAPNEHGIVILNGSSNQVGALGAGNWISGNTKSGVVITGATATGNHIVANEIGVGLFGVAGNGDHGVDIASGGNVVGGDSIGMGNVISGNRKFGVKLGGASATGNQVLGNRLGTDRNGRFAIPNELYGLVVEDASNNVIGATGPHSGNVISGNGRGGVLLRGATATGNSVIGNHIGTDAFGLSTIANGNDGVLIKAPGNIIGSGEPGGGNLISGNGRSGVLIASPDATGNRLEGNWIGLSADAGMLGNSVHGVSISQGRQNEIGTALTGNVISGNGNSGVKISGSASIDNQVLSNRIGTDPQGILAMPNGQSGVFVVGGASGTVIGLAGAGNQISGNQGDGVFIVSDQTDRTTIRGNNIGLDTGQTVTLGNSQMGIRIAAGADATVIGGENSGDGNAIAGNGVHGIYAESLSEHLGNPSLTILGNWIGTNPQSDPSLGNGSNGIRLSSVTDATIGSTTPGSGNVIGQNLVGIRLTDGSDGNQITGNSIGTDQTGMQSLGNAGQGVLIQSGSSDNVVTMNQIAMNAHGVVVNGVSANGAAVGNRISQNEIFGNQFLGIDLGNVGRTQNDPGDPDLGGNTQLNFPVLVAPPTLSANDLQLQLNVDSDPLVVAYPLTVEVFVSDGDGQGRTFLGSVVFTETDHLAGSISASISVVGVNVSDELVTTTIDGAGNTSEFSDAANVE